MEEVQTTNPEDLFEQLTMLKGKTCLTIFYAMDKGGHESDISLLIGNAEEIATENIALEKRPFLLRTVCPWRVDKDLHPFCSWAEKNGKRSPMRRALKQLINKKITEIELNRNTLDLTLSFEGGFSMKIFASFTSNREANCNYALFTPLKIYVIEYKGKIEVKNKKVKILG